MQAKLIFINGKYFIEIPETLVKLYSLESKMIFQIKAVETGNDTVVLNVSAPLNDKSRKRGWDCIYNLLCTILSFC